MELEWNWKGHRAGDMRVGKQYKHRFLKLPVPYGNCVCVPISHHLTVYVPVWHSSVLIVNSEGPSRDSENRWPSDRLQLYINVSGGQHRQHTAGTHHTTITISGLILVSW